MLYYVLDRTSAQQALENESSSVKPETRGSGHPIPQDMIRGVVEALHEELRNLAPNGTLPQQLGAEFERRAVSPVHQLIHRLTSADRGPLYDDGFWRWLAVVHFRDIIKMRHPSKDDRFNLNNFGLGPLSDNFVYRVWLRGEIAYDPERFPDDPYRLARLGDQDFWRSHIFRQSYATPRAFARAFLRFQFEETPEGRLQTKEIRELAKRLRRLYANVVFELLSEEEAFDLISKEAEKVREGA
jgi:hypothetical protein